MVTKNPITTDIVMDATWLASVTDDLLPSDKALFEEAVAWVQPYYEDGTKVLATGEPVLSHSYYLVQVLRRLNLDVSTRIAGLIATALDTDVVGPKDPISQKYGLDVTRLVNGFRSLIRLGALTRDATGPDQAHQAEMMRKMLLAMAADLRIVLMRLGSRLQTLRWYAQTKREPMMELVHEAVNLYAPLANRLGIWQIKWEMEDLAFRFLEPENYKKIASQLEEKRVERELFIQEAVEAVHAALLAEGVESEVTGRPKHIYSIWNKMRNKNMPFSQLYDLRALRIIVDDVRSCYTALGIVHEIWTPVLEEFDDYISKPKPNGYRSLHTILLDKNGRPFEVQIRTKEMHQFAEFGVAAHWRYKEAGAKGGTQEANSDYDRRLSWVRQLLAWKSDVHDQANDESIQMLAPFDDHIYVLTPQAKVVELSPNATPVDFAYVVHTDLGHRCRGAKVDGVMVPLNTKLQSGQTVEIIAAKSGGPSRDWLNPQLGYLASHRSRAKVRQWFNAIDIQERTAQGQTLVEKELQRLGKTAVNLDSLAQFLGFARADDLYVAVAKDEFPVRHVETFFIEPEPELELLPEEVTRESRITNDTKSGVLVVGVDSLLTNLAKCCRPAPPDEIIGFVTRGRGVSIHRADCINIDSLTQQHPERLIEVNWGAQQGSLYAMDIYVQAQDRSGLLRDITEVFTRQRINVVGVNTQTKQHTARMYFTVEVSSVEILAKACTQIQEIKGVQIVKRI